MVWSNKGDKFSSCVTGKAGMKSETKTITPREDSEEGNRQTLLHYHPHYHGPYVSCSLRHLFRGHKITKEDQVQPHILQEMYRESIGV